MEAIETLIPHRNPFLFVHEMEEATQERIIGYYTFQHSDLAIQGSFPEFDYVPGMILVESMAQCGGAGVKMMGITEGLFGLASIESTSFFGGVAFGEKVRYEIRNIRLGTRLIKQSGIAYVNGQAVLESTWMCARIGE